MKFEHVFAMALWEFSRSLLNVVLLTNLPYDRIEDVLLWSIPVCSYLRTCSRCCCLGISITYQRASTSSMLKQVAWSVCCSCSCVCVWVCFFSYGRTQQLQSVNYFNKTLLQHRVQNVTIHRNAPVETTTTTPSPAIGRKLFDLLIGVGTDTQANRSVEPNSHACRNAFMPNASTMMHASCPFRNP